jgi:hypothetical protein
MKRIRIAPILAVLLSIGGGVWWFMTFERATEPVYTGLQGAAREDPFLALRRLFKRSELRLEEPAVAATPATKFENLPAGGTLLLGDRRQLVMAPERVKHIVEWVKAGGHLIVEAEYPGRPDPLLAAFGLGRADLVRPKPAPKAAAGKPAQSDGERDAERDGEDNNATSEAEKKSEPPAAPSAKSRRRRVAEIAEVHLPDGGRPLKVEFGAYQNLVVTRGTRGTEGLKADGLQLASDSLGLRLAIGTHGAGRVSALSNFDFLIYRGTFDEKDVARQPTHLGKYDHAEMVLRLVRLHPNHAQAALRLVWGNDDVSLWTWLADHAAFALASLALLLAVWLWHVVPRFGPLMPDAAPAEQKLASHLEAVGRFYWKHMAPGEIYAKLRAAFVQRLAERRPGIAMRKAAERNAELAQLAGVRAEAVARALDQPAHSVGELIRNAVLLQRLSQML